MKTKIILLLIAYFMVFNTNIFGQKNINNYKYIIVPKDYKFLNSNDQYQLNSLTKFLFKKYGFIALMENENYPEDLTENVCLALRSDAIKTKGFFKLMLTVVLKNCKDKIIYTSNAGESREKDFKKAYHEALRNAFKSFENVNYKYIPNKNTKNKFTKSDTVANQKIKKLKDEIKALKAKKNIETTSTKNIKKEIRVKNNIKTTLLNSNKSTVLYAQKIDNGFQIVNTTPKVVMILLTTPKLDVFIVKGRSAIVYKISGVWYLSEYNGKIINSKSIKIKF